MKTPLNPYSMFSLLVPLLISANIPTSLGADDDLYTDCSSSSFSCGSIQNLTYPFWGGERANYCGLPDFNLTCEASITKITIRSFRYRIRHLEWTAQTLVVARDDYFDTICQTDYKNNTFDQTPFKYVDDGLTNVTFVCDCSSSPPFLSNSQDTNCKGADDDTNITVYYLPEPWYLSDCKSAIQDVLRDGFGLHWMVNTEDCNTCSQSGGQCGYDGQFSRF